MSKLIKTPFPRRLLDLEVGFSRLSGEGRRGIREDDDFSVKVSEGNKGGPSSSAEARCCLRVVWVGEGVWDDREDLEDRLGGM